MATKGHSTTLGFAAPGGSTFTPVAKIVAIKPPSPEAEPIDVSHMESPEQWNEYIAGWAEAGEVEVTAQYAKAETAALYAIFRADKDYKMTFSDGSFWEFSGFLQKMDGEIERKGIIQSTFTFKLSGKPEFTPAA
jgi:predicted secreted protein